jgi:hypothetical protein
MPIFQQILTSYPEQPQALSALVGLYRANALLLTLPSFLAQLGGMSFPAGCQELEELAAYLQSQINRDLGNPEIALSLATALQQTATIQNVAMAAAFDRAQINKYDLGQTALGDSLFAEFIENYPDDELAVIAQVELGTLTPPTTQGAGEGRYAAGVSLPLTYALHPAFPNPFNAEVTFRLDLPYPSNVRLEVFDISGRKIGTVVEGTQMAGQQRFVWNAQTQSGNVLASGIYLCKVMALSLQTNDRYEAVQKILLLK